MEKFEAPYLAFIGYTLPHEYGDNVFACDFVEDRWYLPSDAHPSLNISLLKGRPQRIWYEFVNDDTSPSAVSPPPCIKDLEDPATTEKYIIDHCPAVVSIISISCLMYMTRIQNATFVLTKARGNVLGEFARFKPERPRGRHRDAEDRSTL